MNKSIERRIRVASGQEPADLVLQNARVVNVFSQTIERGDVAIADGTIAGIGHYRGTEEVDLRGALLAPGLIDAHVHIESSMAALPEFAKAVVRHGVTCVIADPHEIANVAGLDGIRAMLDSTRDLPIDVYFMLPSCVPTSAFETAGACLDADALAPLIDDPRVLGLGEMMNYPGVIAADPDVLAKLRLAAHKRIDGHAPGVTGQALAAYAAAGVQTDHECESVDELREKVDRGLYVLLREGSAARNVEALLTGVTDRNMRRCLFCTDDRHAEDILREGSVDNNIRVAIRKGFDPIAAIVMATHNAAECYGLRGRGAIAPGYAADLVAFDDLATCNVVATWKDGRLLAKKGHLLARGGSQWPATAVRNSVRIGAFDPSKLALPIDGVHANVIEVLPHSIVTKKTVRIVRVTNGHFVAGDGFAKLAVVERHRATGNVGLGIVAGFGLRNGAIASTVAHDSHNLICIGDNDADMAAAIAEIERMGGGLCVAREGQIVQSLALPIAGLMSPDPIEAIAARSSALKEAAIAMGVSPGIDPFMTLAFLSLPVIPSIKLTDCGLFDVDRFAFVPVSAE